MIDSEQFPQLEDLSPGSIQGSISVEPVEKSLIATPVDLDLT
ncbi:MAG: hypothetical protein SWJ54_00355 [Cyanobacteriota bacterium]|nr:hypothetical protein [Cyanobacteriota bacterium]